MHNFLFDDNRLLFWLVIIAIVITINWRTIEISPVKNLRWIMAAAGLLVVAALAAAALASVQSIFGSIGEMNSWIVDSGQRLIVQRMESSYSLFAIFMAASFALPINFTIVISEHISNRQAGVTVWAYPLLMLLARHSDISPAVVGDCSAVLLAAAVPVRPAAMTGHWIVAGLGAAGIVLIAIALLCNVHHAGKDVSQQLYPATNHCGTAATDQLDQ